VLSYRLDPFLYWTDVEDIVSVRIPPVDVLVQPGRPDMNDIIGVHDIRKRIVRFEINERVFALGKVAMHN
jgi:hypothetical protein